METPTHTAPPVASTDLLALRIQSLIADKWMIVASANRDLTCYGDWRTDYNAFHHQTDAEIQVLFSQANAKMEAPNA
jgi:hypothetical protein